MILWLFHQIRSIREALAGRDRPEELAWGVAIGALIGVVPKGNLIAVGLICVAFALRINHAMAAVTAVAVSFAALLFDPFTHGMGQWILEQSSLQAFYAWAWSQPIVPWTNLNNTVVMGSLVMGLIALIPIYNVTLPMFQSLTSGESESEEAEVQSTVSADKMIDKEESRLSEARTIEKRVDVVRILRPNQPAEQTEIVTTSDKQENAA